MTARCRIRSTRCRDVYTRSMRMTLLIALALGLATGLLLLGGCGSDATRTADSGADDTPGASVDATAQAEATLGSFFDAWSAKDQTAAEAFLPSDRRGMSWGFDTLDTVEFGPITPYSEGAAGYLQSGRGSVTGVAPEAVRCFKADVTFRYLPGRDGPSPDGETLEWMWFLERGDDGVWLVTDWGY